MQRHNWLDHGGTTWTLPQDMPGAALNRWPSRLLPCLHLFPTDECCIDETSNFLQGTAAAHTVESTCVTQLETDTSESIPYGKERAKPLTTQTSPCITPPSSWATEAHQASSTWRPCSSCLLQFRSACIAACTYAEKIIELDCVLGP